MSQHRSESAGRVGKALYDSMESGCPRSSTTSLPTPCVMGSSPSKRGRVQSTGAGRRHYPMTDWPGPAATTRWPLPNKRHPAHPRTDHAHHVDVTEPAKTTSLQTDWHAARPITSQLLEAVDLFLVVASRVVGGLFEVDAQCIGCMHEVAKEIRETGGDLLAALRRAQARRIGNESVRPPK